jgi:hypothetical protein
MENEFVYFANWIKKPKESSDYFLWNCGNRYEIIIVQYKNNIDNFYVEYSDQWTIPFADKMPVVSIKCSSLHYAKLIGDKVAKECESWLTRS